MGKKKLDALGDRMKVYEEENTNLST